MLSPQQIVVDGESYDTRDRIALSQVDRWVKSAKKHPFIVGTNAAQYMELYLEAERASRSGVLVIQTSKKVIRSYLASKTAQRSFSERSALPVEIVDTYATDIWAGLYCFGARRMLKSGASLADTANRLREQAQRQRVFIAIETLEYLVKGGRATMLRSWMADLFGVRPILSIVDGELKVCGKYKTSRDSADALLDHIREEVPAVEPMWVAIGHGQRQEAAERFADELKKTYDVETLIIRPLSTSIYLHGGPGSMGVSIGPASGFG